MIDEKDNDLPETAQENLPIESSSEIDVKALNEESLQIINSVITEQDPAKTKDLTYLFNANQNKKAMVRVNKFGELLDTLADQALTRFSKKPDEISNQELLQGMKVVQDIIERGTKQVSGVSETPLIQINQQHNELNVNDSATALSKESRDKVKNAVMSLLANIEKPEVQPVTEIKEEENSDDGNK